MKRQIRKGCWETNSSSTCSLVIMTEDDYYKKWNRGFYLYKPWNYKYEIEHDYLDETHRPIEKQLYSEDEVKQFLLHSESVSVDNFDFDSEESSYSNFEELAYDNNFYSLDKFDGELETKDEKYEMSDGNVIIAYCAYGYD